MKTIRDDLDSPIRIAKKIGQSNTMQNKISHLAEKDFFSWNNQGFDYGFENYNLESEFQYIKHRHIHYLRIKHHRRGYLSKRLTTIENQRSVDSITVILSHWAIHKIYSNQKFLDYFIHPTMTNYQKRREIVLKAVEHFSIRQIEAHLHISHHTIQRMINNEIHLTKQQKMVYNLINQNVLNIPMKSLIQQTHLSKRQLYRHLKMLDRNELIIVYPHQEYGRNRFTSVKIL